MSAGLIPIARRCPGLSDIITHGENGYLFDSIDEAKILIENLTLKNIDHAMIEYVKNYVKNYYSVKKMVDNTQSLTRLLLKKEI